MEREKGVKTPFALLKLCGGGGEEKFLREHNKKRHKSNLL